MTELVSVGNFHGREDVLMTVEAEEEGMLADGSLRDNPLSTKGGAKSTLNRVSKWIVAGFFGVIVLWRHDAESLWAAMGSVVNTCIALVLKKAINHQRPVPQLKSDPGMPSSHAQSIFYAGCFAIFSLFHWWGMNPHTVIAAALILAGSLYFSWLRVSQQFHTGSQVVVGAILGSAFAFAWLWFWHTFLLLAFKSLTWVRVTTLLASVSCCAGFVVYAFRHWLNNG